MRDEILNAGVEGIMVACLHPSATHGTMIELFEMLYKT
jgi:hypothetical protein